MIRVHLRVSTDGQDADSQRHAVEKWLTAYGDGGEVARYIEEGVMGDAKERPVLDRLVAESQPGDTVVCFALDRLSRGGIIETLKIWHDFRNRGIRLVSLCELWADTDNPSAEVVIAVMAWAAQQEKRRLHERVRAGIAAARARGEKWGGSKKGRRINLTESKERKARELLAKGLGPTEVSRVVKLGRATIYRMLKAKQEAVES